MMKALTKIILWIILEHLNFCVLMSPLGLLKGSQRLKGLSYRAWPWLSQCQSNFSFEPKFLFLGSHLSPRFSILRRKPESFAQIGFWWRLNESLIETGPRSLEPKPNSDPEQKLPKLCRRKLWFHFYQKTAEPGISGQQMRPRDKKKLLVLVGWICCSRHQCSLRYCGSWKVQLVLALLCLKRSAVIYRR